MTVDAIFAEALAKRTPEERTAYLDDACAEDLVLRQRIEALLKSHEAAGAFLGKPAIQCAAQELAGQANTDDTQGELLTDDDEIESLDFLAPTDKPGSLGRLGFYDVQEVIGRGGMGIVFRAFDDRLHRVVAIKVMAARLATSAAARKRFTREAQAAAAVCHDHIVTIHAVEEAAPFPNGAESKARGLPYLVMQYVSGMSLQERLDRGGALELHEILRIGMQTAAGLAAAHAQGLIHRDIKPANILLENGVERVKITDFGLARVADDASLTQSGVVAGTPHYMAPEQARGEALDARTDLFSLGSVLYATCTGRAPFRASGTMAVLKRVCEETPTPIRETNPTIPNWLVAIIEKLHGKDPAERYQSAAEVAELLGRHLAHVQHPSVALPPAPLSPVSPLERRARSEGRSLARRRWAIAAAVLSCFVAGLSLTEATGVTSFRATAIRVFTPDGTLIVEVDDPAVMVTVEGDGGIVITGAGPQEVRLRPGSYKVQAAKDGKPVRLDQELVTINRGDKQVVRVRLEGEAVAGKIAAKGELGVFVLLGATGVVVRRFDTLAEAVLGASACDTIEIRGNGPFFSAPIKLTQALTIRAGAGFCPVIQLQADASHRNLPLLKTVGALVLEGLVLQRTVPDAPNEGDYQILDAEGSRLYVANCQFLGGNAMENLRGIAITTGSLVCEVRNTQLLCPETCLSASLQPGQQLIMDNCVQSHSGFRLEPGMLDDKRPALIRITRNTCIAVTMGHVVAFWLFSDKRPPPRDVKRTTKLRVETLGNIFDACNALHVARELPDNILPTDDVERLLTQTISWQGQRNLFALQGHFLQHSDGKLLDSTKPLIGLEEWKRFWGSTETNSLKGIVRYHGGDLRSKLRAESEKLTPEDFRLRPDSPGYKAGKNGKDLGADIDLVGPGPAYERWKKTPDYQQWLKDSGQVKQPLEFRL